MASSPSPKIDDLATKVGDISIGEEATDAVKSPKSASSPKPVVGSPGTAAKLIESPTRPASPKVGSPTITATKSSPAKSPKSDNKTKEASPSVVVKDGEKKTDDKIPDGTPKSDDGVFESSDKKNEDNKKSGDENDEQTRERIRSRTGSYRYRNPKFAGLTTPPFRDNYFKHGEKSESEVNSGETGDSPKPKKVVTVVPDTQHDRPGFFVGRTRRQSEKSDGGSKNDGGDANANKRNQRPRNWRRNQRPPPGQFIDYQPRGYRGGPGFYRQSSYQPQPTYYDEGFDYYQGQPFQQRPNFNRGVQRGFSYPGPPNFGGQFQQMQYAPRQSRKQGNPQQNRQPRTSQRDSSSFFDNFGGDQPQQQRKNKNKRRRSRTSSKRDRTASTASSTKQAAPAEAREVAIAVNTS